MSAEGNTPMEPVPMGDKENGAEPVADAAAGGALDGASPNGETSATHSALGVVTEKVSPFVAAISKSMADLGDKARPAVQSATDKARPAVQSATEKAGPPIREFAARAADVTAIFADKAGPVAHKVADVTGDFTASVAVHSREWAADLRKSDGNGTASATATLERGEDVVEGAAAEAADKAASAAESAADKIDGSVAPA
ncbi:MAG: hypothetical protein ACHQ3P_04960 [Candidatus Limnocylindrales bacterium]